MLKPSRRHFVWGVAAAGGLIIPSNGYSFSHGNSGAASPPPPPPPPPPGSNVHVLIASGQSNSASNGSNGQAVPTEYATPDPGIVVWNGTAWSTYTVGTNSDYEPHLPAGPGVAGAFWGPEAEWTHQWRLANPTLTLYVIKYDQGGTGLAYSSNPNTVAAWSTFNVASLCDGLVTFANGALANLTTAGFTPVIDAMIWTQWENDSNTLAPACAYGPNLQRFLTRLRANFLPATTPFIFGGARSGVSGESFATTTYASQAGVSTYDAHAYMIDQNGITNHTALHPNPQGIFDVGTLYWGSFTGGVSKIVLTPGAQTLSLDFTTGTYTGATPANVNSSGGYGPNADGSLVSIAANALRRGSGGLMVEWDAKNVVPSPGAMSGWTLVGTPTVTANAATAPDGTTTMTQVAAAASAGIHSAGGNIFGGSAYSGSVYLGTVSGTNRVTVLVGTGSTNSAITVNASTGAIISQAAIFNSSAAMTQGPTGIWRLTFAFTATINTSSQFFVEADGTGACTFLTWGPSLCTVKPDQPQPSYLAAQRAIDAVSFTIPASTVILTLTFDDNSTQKIGVLPGTFNLPVTVTRPIIKSIVGN